MKPFIAFIESSHPQYVRFTELYSLTEDEAQEEALQKARLFIAALNYEPNEKKPITLFRTTVFICYNKLECPLIYRSCCERISATRGFYPMLSKFVYYINNNFYWLKSYLYVDGDKDDTTNIHH